MTRLSDNFTRRPDNCAGDIIWPEELQPQECSRSINWWAVLGMAICLASAFLVGGVVVWVVL